MTVEEIFSKIAAHAVKGMMAHDQLANYYHFLGLEGCKSCHEYHFLKETLSYRNIQDFYINKYNKLIPDERVDDPKILPENWYKHVRQDVNGTTKRSAVKTAIDTWHSWEADTHKTYCEFYKELEALEEYGAAKKVKELIRDVEEELADIQMKSLKLNDLEYSLSYLHFRQQELKECYDKKKCKLLKVKED